MAARYDLGSTEIGARRTTSPGESAGPAPSKRDGNVDSLTRMLGAIDPA